MRLLSRGWLPCALITGILAAPATGYANNGIDIGLAGHHTGFVYLDDNTAGANTISGFSRGADGPLTPLPGSPFSAGGQGLGAGLGSQGAIQTTDNGRYLLAVDAGSNQISVLRIGVDGSLTPVPGSPFASEGVEPNSIAVNDGLVYVSNAGSGGTNYTGFTLSPAGRLDPIPGSTVTLPAGSGLGDIVLNNDNTKLAGVRVTMSLIDSFTLDRSGRPHAAPGSPYAAQGSGRLAASSAPPIPTSCSSPMLTTASASEPSRRMTTSSTARCSRSAHRRSLISKLRRAGRSSAPMVSIRTPSIRDRPRSRATQSHGTAR
jgi:hypothetical protein